MGLLIFGGRGSAPVSVHYGKILVVTLDSHVLMTFELYVDELLESIGMGVGLEKKAARGFAGVRHEPKRITAKMLLHLCHINLLGRFADATVKALQTRQEVY